MASTNLLAHPSLTNASELANAVYVGPLPRPRARKRTISLMSVSSAQTKISLDFPKVEPSAATTLHHLAHDAYGSFIPTASAEISLRHIRTLSTPPVYPLGLKFQTHRKRSKSWFTDNDSPLSSGLPSPTIPSICRTTSSPDWLSPTTTSPPSRQWEPRLEHERQSIDKLNPILAKLERKSKLCTRKVYCATCHKPGIDYPRCAKCGDMWCSRECRLYGGKRHVCGRKSRDNH